MTAPFHAPEAIAPSYVCDVDRPIKLYEGPAVLRVDGRETEGACTIHYVWKPSEGPEVVFRPSVFGTDHHGILRVPAIGLESSVMIRSSQFGPADAACVGLLDGDVTMGVSQGLSLLKFHIANFPAVFGEPIKNGTHFLRARIHLECDGWCIDIDPVPSVPQSGTGSLQDRLSEARGFAITHVGALSRLDRAPFGAADAEAPLMAVARTLSFARGAFSTPLLREGYGAAGDRVWADWSTHRTRAWTPHETWFSSHEPDILQSVFAGWMRLAGEPIASVVDAAAHLYNDSHTQGLAMESKLVLAQSALEGLADGWPFPPLPNAPQIPASLAPDSAARRIAAIAVSLGLPLTVPTSLPHLAALTNPSPTATAQEKMTWVRNRVAHLQTFPRLAALPWQVRHDARSLAALHLELALLRLLEARGLYMNRLTAKHHGAVEPLPWAAGPGGIP